MTELPAAILRDADDVLISFAKYEEPQSVYRLCAMSYIHMFAMVFFLRAGLNWFEEKTNKQSLAYIKLICTRKKEGTINKHDIYRYYRNVIVGSHVMSVYADT